MHHCAGVAIIVNNKWINTIIDIQQINERIMYITLNHTIPITIICRYAPTSVATKETKDKYYDTLKSNKNTHQQAHTAHIR